MGADGAYPNVRPSIGNAGHRFDNELRYRPANHPRQTAYTPEYILDPVRRLLGGIELDPCTTAENPVGAERFYYPPMDGLKLSWEARSIFVNPPYGKAREPWVFRCIDAGRAGSKVVLLIPAHMDTQVMQTALYTASSVLFIKGRVKFGVLRPNRRQMAASHPSLLLGWNVQLWLINRLGMAVDLIAGRSGERSVA